MILRCFSYGSRGFPILEAANDPKNQVITNKTYKNIYFAIYPGPQKTYTFLYHQNHHHRILGHILRKFPEKVVMN